MNELHAYFEKVAQDLNRTEIEQRILEGDEGNPIYRYTLTDAIDTTFKGDWGADYNAADSDRNLYGLPELRRAA